MKSGRRVHRQFTVFITNEAIFTSSAANNSLPANPNRQLVLNAGQLESARGGFADYARDDESAKELRARVNRTILEDLETKVLALCALHAKLRDLDAGQSFGDVVARPRLGCRGSVPS